MSLLLILNKTYILFWCFHCKLSVVGKSRVRERGFKVVSDYGFLVCELGEILSRFFVTQKFEIILASALLKDEKYIQFDKSL